MSKEELEKEAEEYRDGKAREIYHHVFGENAGSPADFAKRCFQDGAEFGYNKCFEQIRKIVNEHTRLDSIIPELLRLQEIGNGKKRNQRTVKIL